MCYNCGCGIPDDDMGHPDNITTKTFESLSRAIAKDVANTKKLVFEYSTGNESLSENEKQAVDEMFEKASNAWGQSIDDAKKETGYMLKREVSHAQ